MYGLVEAQNVVAAEMARRDAPPAPLTPMQLMQRALEAGNLELVERMMTLQERWEATQSRKDFEAAMAACRAELPVIIKTNSGANGAYVYEDLAGIAKQIDPVLARHGLSYRFRTQSGEKRLTVVCIISHASGHSEENSLSAAVSPSSRLMNDIQSIGAAQTYLQRYTLKAALGLSASKDTDAQTIAQAAPDETGELISAEQIQTLTAALKVREIDEKEWLKRASAALKIKMETLSDIPISSFKRCLDNVRQAGEPQ